MDNLDLDQLLEEINNAPKKVDKVIFKSYLEKKQK
jgi:hypothetical protein